jgi:hypothetical protein
MNRTAAATRFEVQKVGAAARSGTAALMGARLAVAEASLRTFQRRGRWLWILVPAGSGKMSPDSGSGAGRASSGGKRWRIRGRRAAAGWSGTLTPSSGDSGYVQFLRGEIRERGEIQEDVEGHFLSNNDSLSWLVSETKNFH